MCLPATLTDSSGCDGWMPLVPSDVDDPDRVAFIEAASRVTQPNASGRYEFVCVWEPGTTPTRFEFDADGSKGTLTNIRSGEMHPIRRKVRLGTESAN